MKIGFRKRQRLTGRRRRRLKGKIEIWVPQGESIAARREEETIFQAEKALPLSARRKVIKGFFRPFELSIWGTRFEKKSVDKGKEFLRYPGGNWSLTIETFGLLFPSKS